MESTSKLIDYLLLVGPGHNNVTFEPVTPPTATRGAKDRSRGGKGAGSRLQGWHSITTPTPTILRRFSPSSHHDHHLVNDVVYFCQPEGCCIELDKPKSHVFMLTDTETNIRTYGVCLTIPHLFDPPKNKGSPSSKCSDDINSISIQEWGILSICILSHHPFFNFFAKSLKTLAHFIEHFGSKEQSWNELIHAAAKSDSRSKVENGTKAKVPRKSPFVVEIEAWIENLLQLPAPEEGRRGLEVELEVEPEVFVCYPPKNHLPLCDLHLHHMFQKVGVHTTLEIFKLVLSEQKVILYSRDPAFASECVLVLLTLFYPLQYLYPVIPLLPASMPTSENLLMVPTPYLIGVGESFMKKVRDFQVAETWVVALDTKQIKEPSILDQPVLKFPFRILQLQADIRKALDRVHDLTGLTDTGHDRPSQPVAVPVSGGSTNHAHSTSPSGTGAAEPVSSVLGEDNPYDELLNEVDVKIRLAFVQFLFDPELLGHIDQHLCIYRLFPRPVVALRSSAFLMAYKTCTPTAEVQFIQELIKTQCVEYFFQYSLNPSNVAFEEIKKGVVEVGRLSDKLHLSSSSYVNSQGNHQVSLYSHSPDSLLYQEMLSYKASKDTDDCSSGEWDILSGDNYDGDSEASSFSDKEEEEEGEGDNDLTPMTSISRLPTRKDKGGTLTRSNPAPQLQEEVEVGYHTPKGFSKSFEEWKENEVDSSDKQLHDTAEGMGGAGNRKPHISRGMHITPKVNVLHMKKSSSMEYLSSSAAGQLSDDPQTYFTPGGGEEDSPGVELGVRGARPHRKRVGLEEREDRRYQNITRQHHHTYHGERRSPEVGGRGAPVKRGSSLIMKGERGGGGGTPLTRGNSVTSQSPSNSHSLELQIQDLVSKIVEGQGLPWPKPAHLKRLACQERSRLQVLRLLEEKLGTRETGDMVMAKSEQIIAVGVSKAVFKGVLELLKYLIVCIEEEVHKDPEVSTFSIFLIFRLAFSIYLPPKTQKFTIGISLLNALNLNSFVAPNPTPSLSREEATPTTTDASPTVRHRLSRDLPTISISDTDEETEELHFLRSERRRGRRGSSPLVMRKLDSSSLVTHASSPPSNRPKSPVMEFASERTPSVSPLVARSAETSAGPGAATPTSSETEPRSRESSLPLEMVEEIDEENEGEGNGEGGEKEGSLSHQESEDPKEHQEQPPSKLSECESEISLFQEVEINLPDATPPPDTSPILREKKPIHRQAESFPTLSTRSYQLSPLEASVPSSPQHPPTSSPDPSHHSRPATPSKQALLLSELINSPRFYHPQEGQDLTGCTFLYRELMKGLGHSKNFLLSRHFWNQTFISAVTMERESLGWNEWTVSLYEKYDSLSESDQQTFGSAEDQLLSIILHNLLVCMLVVGLSPHDTTEIVHRFSARTRLSMMEEKLLQRTLKHVEDCIEEEGSGAVDLNMLGMLALYSEVHPTVSYIIHYGTNVLAPVYKLQVTDEVLILRRFPDDKICSRLWNDCISIVRYSKGKATVSVCHREAHGDVYYHHFHTKQYMKVYEALQALVSPGTVHEVEVSVDSETSDSQSAGDL